MDRLSFNGVDLPVRILETGNRNAYAKIRDMEVIISVPKRIKGARRDDVVSKLSASLMRSLERNPGKMLGFSRERFRDGQELAVPGMSLRLSISQQGGRFGYSLKDGILSIRMPPDVQVGSARASSYIHMAVSRAFLPAVSAYVEELNRERFGSGLGRVRIGRGMTNLGSCDMLNNITLNSRLFAMGPYALEYVAVHELAHTRFHDHSKRFWGEVERALPDYRERRRWIFREGWKMEA
jgi:hypothetical protein